MCCIHELSTEFGVLSPHVYEFIAPANQFNGFDNLLQIVSFNQARVRSDGLDKRFFNESAGQEQLTHSEFNNAIRLSLGPVSFL